MLHKQWFPSISSSASVDFKSKSLKLVLSSFNNHISAVETVKSAIYEELFDRQACNGWRDVRLMKHGRSQIPVSPLIEPTEGGLCCGEVPQSSSEEHRAFPQVKRKLASWGNNIYVLDFKRFLPVRKSRCKGVFFYLKDLTKLFFLFWISFFFSSWWSDRVWHSIISTHRGRLS